jgi:hypothetical protein
MRHSQIVLGLTFTLGILSVVPVIWATEPSKGDLADKPFQATNTGLESSLFKTKALAIAADKNCAAIHNCRGARFH